VPEGCTNLGTALAAGRLAPSDPAAAARALRKACDAGGALACHRLALLLGDRSEPAGDLSAAALEATACAGGVARACAALGKEAPAPGARSPAARLLADPGSFVLAVPGTGGFSPGELAPRREGARPRRVAGPGEMPASLLASVPHDLRGRLGLDGPASADRGGDGPVELLLAFRRTLLGQCHEAERERRGVEAEAFAVLSVDGDGRPANVRAASRPAEPALEACVRAVVEGWEFPASERGDSGPFVVRHAYEAARGPAPASMGPGFVRPALREAGCAERVLRMPEEYRGLRGGLTVRLAVDATGEPGLVHPLTPVPDAVAAALEEAVRACAWAPGGDAEGRPAALWTTLTVRIDGR
jgi:hypothetical protein